MSPVAVLVQAKTRYAVFERRPKTGTENVPVLERVPALTVTSLVDCNGNCSYVKYTSTLVAAPISRSLPVSVALLPVTLVAGSMETNGTGVVMGSSVERVVKVSILPQDLEPLLPSMRQNCSKYEVDGVSSVKRA